MLDVDSDNLTFTNRKRLQRMNIHDFEIVYDGEKIVLFNDPASSDDK